MAWLDKFGPDIRIADEDGSNQVVLRGRNAPYPVPNLKRPYGVELSVMRQGADGAGLRVAQVSGTDISHSDLELPIALFEPEQVEAMWTKYDRVPAAPVAVTLDGGTTWYRAVFAQQGWGPERWTFPWTNEGGTIRLHILGTLTIPEP